MVLSIPYTVCRVEEMIRGESTHLSVAQQLIIIMCRVSLQHWRIGLLNSVRGFYTVTKCVLQELPFLLMCLYQICNQKQNRWVAGFPVKGQISKTNYQGCVALNYTPAAFLC